MAMAEFRWAVPSWALEDYEKLALLLHIDFEDYASGNSGDRFDFDALYNGCFSEELEPVSK